MECKNWQVPHRARLERQIEPGQVLCLKGRIVEEIPEEFNNRITINLAKDGGEGGEIPMHISIRFDSKETVFNCKGPEGWGKEEKKKVPFKAGEPFDLRIRAHGDKFEILIDQKTFHEFHHRMPLSSVQHLYVDGPIYLTCVMWGGKYYSVPYEAAIQSGFGPGKRLFVSGVPEKKCTRFHVNLLTRDGDVALHFNPRFDEKKVVRNSKQRGEWGNEEREGAFPFKKDIGFDLIFHNESYSYQIYINDERYCTFAHRVDPNTITGVEVGGEIELQAVQSM